jgi:hypothetical protein
MYLDKVGEAVPVRCPWDVHGCTSNARLNGGGGGRRERGAGGREGCTGGEAEPVWGLDKWAWTGHSGRNRVGPEYK